MRNWEEFSPNAADLDEGPYAFCHLAPLPWSLHLELATSLRTREAQLISVDLDDRRLSEAPHSEVARLMGLVDLFMPSRQDVAEIFPHRTPVDAMKALRELSPATPVIVVKCGAAGAIAHERNASDYLSSPSAAVEQAVDETGAGDAFAAARWSAIPANAPSGRRWPAPPCPHRLPSRAWARRRSFPLRWGTRRFVCVASQTE
jgi:sugar/nucleoside kinase (ribokinase family)